MRRFAWLAALLLAPTLAIGQTPTPAPTPYIIGPAGPYTFQTTGATKVEYGDGWVKISWVLDPGPTPIPIPGPGPGPGPTPPPVPPPPAPVATGKLYVTYVYDSTAETQAQAATRADLATASEWAGLDVVFRSYEKTQKAIDDLNLRGTVSSAALPCVVVQELKAGATSAPVVKTVPSVASKDSVVAAVKELRGSK